MQAADAGARREQPREQKRLPKWESLGIEMREALIFVYFQAELTPERPDRSIERFTGLLS